MPRRSSSSQQEWSTNKKKVTPLQARYFKSTFFKPLFPSGEEAVYRFVPESETPFGYDVLIDAWTLYLAKTYNFQFLIFTLLPQLEKKKTKLRKHKSQRLAVFFGVDPFVEPTKHAGASETPADNCNHYRSVTFAQSSSHSGVVEENWR